MAIDRGELRYNLRTVDQFSADLRRFRKELDGIRAAAARPIAVGTDARGTRRQTQQIRQQTVSLEQQRRLRADAIRQSQRRVRDERTITEQTRRTARENRRVGQTQQRVARTQQQVVRAQRQIADGTQRTARGLSNVNRQAGRLLFTFRRLVGALAAFAVAREVASQFRNLVVLGIQFNGQLQIARLGFAGLVSAAGQIRDLQGNLVQGADRFNAALQVGSRIQAQIRQRALETTATVQELSIAFQQAIAPGLARGLNVDQILDLTVSISQAATAIGLSQNQLAEETRAILTGTARAQTTRLAQLFGGAADLNLLVRSASDADDLFRRLQERFRGTADAARQAARTVPGLLARIRDALGAVVGGASLQLFDRVQTVLEDIFNTLLVVNEESGKFEPNPNTLRVFQAIFNSVDRIAARAVEFSQSIGLDGLATAARVFGAGLEIAAGAISGVAQGFRVVFQVISAIATPFAELVGGAENLVPFLVDIAATFAQIATTIAIIRTVTFLWNNGLTAVNASLSTTATRLQTAVATVALIPAILTAAVFGVTQFVNLITGANLAMGQTVRIIGEGIVASLETATRAAGQFFGELSAGIREDLAGQLATDAVPKIEAEILKIRAALQAGQISEGDAAKLIGAANKVIADITGEAQSTADELDNLRAERDNIFQAVDDLLADDGELNRILSENAGEGSTDLADTVAESIARIREQLSVPLPPFTIGAPGGEVTLEQEQQLLRAQQQARQTEAEASALSRVNAIRRVGGTIQQEQLAVTQNRINGLQLEQELQQQSFDLERERLELTLTQAQGEEQKANAQAQIFALRDEEIAQIDLTTQKLEAQKRVLEEQRLVLEGTLGEGLQQGLRNFAEQFSSAFEAGVRIAEGVVQRFSSFVSQSIVDALDPSKDFDIRERFARFLQDLAQLILQQFIQLAIARTLLGIPAVGGLAGGGQVPSFAEGGTVPGGPSHESSPPPGVPKSDTVLARLTPGEWVDPVSTVARLGTDFFDRLRKGAGDPMALRALVGLSKGKKARSSGPSSNRGQYFQGGGQVGRAQQAASEGGGGSGREDAPAPGVALVVGNDQTAERILNGGRSAVFDFFKDNAQSLDGILARARRR